jgi:hypothetical protein
MSSDLERTDGDGDRTPSTMQEVEYALILSRIIGKVEADPAQMRSMVYEFARAKLKTDMLEADDVDRKRLTAALETAIHGVEGFSKRQEREAVLQIAPQPATSAARPPAVHIEQELQAVMEHDVWHGQASSYTKSFGAGAPRHPALKNAWWKSWRGIGALAAAPLILGVVYLLANFHSAQRPGGKVQPNASAAAEIASQIPAQPIQPSPPANSVVTAPVATSLGFPIPAVYGVYVINNGELAELSPLQEVVPDRRVAISTPLGKPEREVLVDGNAKFVIFRRDASSLPDRIDVRVVARVTRALKFDAKGKGSFSPVTDAWNIRSNLYEFRVRPVPGNPDMLLVQPETDAPVLPPGRYVLVLKNQGYDFTVRGPVTDLAHCLERTDAANGAFYSACQKS